MRSKQTGLTLLEVVATLAITAVLVSVAAPPLSGLVSNGRRTAVINDLLATIHLARSTAIRRNRQVVICPAGAGQSCDLDADWQQGWLVFVNEDYDQPPELDPNETVVHRHGPVTHLNLHSNRRFYAFHRIGLRNTNGTLTACDRHGPTRARAVIVSYTGRPRVSDRRADGSALHCL